MYLTAPHETVKRFRLSNTLSLRYLSAANPRIRWSRHSQNRVRRTLIRAANYEKVAVIEMIFSWKSVVAADTVWQGGPARLDKKCVYLR